MHLNALPKLQPQGDRFRVSLRTLLWYVLLYACFFAIYSTGPTGRLELVVATAVTTMFVAVDVWRGPLPASIPWLARAGAIVAYYSLAMALCLPQAGYAGGTASTDQALATSIGKVCGMGWDPPSQRLGLACASGWSSTPCGTILSSSFAVCASS